MSLAKMASVADTQLGNPERPYPPTQRLEMLDAWRGLCCLMLVVFHAAMQSIQADCWEQSIPVTDLSSAALWIVARLWIGVPIFFVISGYCIMATLSSRAGRGGTREFLVRRAIRIYPPYLAALLISGVAIVLLENRWPGLLVDGTFTIQDPRTLGWDAWLGNLTLTESWRHCLFGGPAAHLLPNTWTLAYEEQFYLVAALLLAIVPRRLLTGFAVFTVIALAGKVASKVLDVEVAGSLFDGQWLLIGAGLLVYYRIHFARGWQVHAVHALLGLGALAHLTNPESLLQAMPNHEIARFIAFSFALGMSLTFRIEGPIARSRWLLPLRQLGTISYSVYLSHAVVVKSLSHAAYRWGITSPAETLVLVVPSCVAASLAVGILFYRWIERPTQGRRSEKRQANPLPQTVTPNISATA